jgi:hypothetical protein
MSKKKWLKVGITTIVWSLIYWGVAINMDRSWLNIAVVVAFVSSVFVTAMEE